MTKNCHIKQVCCTSRREIHDWMVILIITIIGGYLELGGIRPHIKCIPGLDIKCSDSDLSPNPDLQYPLIDPTVSDALLITIAVCPWLLYFVLNLIFIHWKSSSMNPTLIWRYAVIHLKCLILSLMLTLLITDIIKLSVGQERPYFQVAHGTDDEYSARRSFPSGHASLGLSTNALLSICMLYAFKIVMKNITSRSKKSDDSISLFVGNNSGILFFGGHLWYILSDFQLLSVLICFLPCVIGVWCGCTRITDYYHFPVDVLAGFCVGIFVAFLTFYVFKDELFFDGIENNEVDEQQNNCGTVEIELKTNEFD